jgi:hypothetical protein
MSLMVAALCTQHVKLEVECTSTAHDAGQLLLPPPLLLLLRLLLRLSIALASAGTTSSSRRSQCCRLTLAREKQVSHTAMKTDLAALSLSLLLL